MALVATQASAELEELFGAASPLARSLSGFAPRAGQTEMAEAVAGAIHDGANLVVEAGTGTGKTLAYLVPALLSGRRVILSTGTKTLQDQLFHRDLPAVTAALGRPATVVQLKGRANYLCMYRLEAARGMTNSGIGAGDLQALSRWGRKTLTGDIVEVEQIPEGSPVWPKVTSTLDNCLGSKCDFYDHCHVVTARQAAMSADIVVVNHHLLLADLVLKEEGFGELLPGSEAVVIDEAHQFPDIAQDFFNIRLSSRAFSDIAADVRAEALSAMPADAKVGGHCDALLDSVRDMRLALPRNGNNLLWDEIDPDCWRELDSLIDALDDLIGWHECADESMAGLKRCRDRLCALVERIDSITGADESAGLRWVGLTATGFTLNYTPVEFSANLQALLSAQECAWIFTSATLAVRGDFAHFTTRMGLEDARTLEIPSPFNYPTNGLLYLPDRLPEPGSRDYTAAVIAKVLPLLQASEGRAFLLFTSHRAVQEAAAVLRDDSSFDYPLLVQGEAPRSKLLEQFVALDKPVLLGTSSFWEGVDIRGDQLVLVVIDKLPFASPGDPMLKARLEAIRQHGGRPFPDYQLPQAALSLKQGVGRLIRDQADYGVVVVCDPRISNRSYGKYFLDCLPPFPVTRDRADAARFLNPEAVE